MPIKQVKNHLIFICDVCGTQVSDIKVPWSFNIKDYEDIKITTVCSNCNVNVNDDQPPPPSSDDSLLT